MGWTWPTDTASGVVFLLFGVISETGIMIIMHMIHVRFYINVAWKVQKIQKRNGTMKSLTCVHGFHHGGPTRRLPTKALPQPRKVTFQKDQNPTTPNAVCVTTLCTLRLYHFYLIEQWVASRTWLSVTRTSTKCLQTCFHVSFPRPVRTTKTIRSRVSRLDDCLCQVAQASLYANINIYIWEKKYPCLIHRDVHWPKRS